MGPVIRNVIRDCIRPVMGDEALVSRLLLDKFTGAAAAYSLETLSVDTDNVVRVRRSSDDTEQDFNATEVVNGTLTGFCGAGNGFVTTWYDQSGNGRNATQATDANQPQIVSAGALVTENGKPAISNSGTQFLEVGSSTSTFKFLHDGTKAYVAGVASFGTSANPDDLLVLLGTFNGGSTNVGYFLGYDDRSSVSSNNGYRARVGNGAGSGNYSIDNYASNVISTQTQVLISSLVDANASPATDRDVGKINGGADLKNNVNTSLPSASSSSDNFQIFATGGSLNLQGSGKCVLIYDSDQSANRAAIEAKLADIYGITLA